MIKGYKERKALYKEGRFTTAIDPVTGKKKRMKFKDEIWAFNPITGSPIVRIRQQYIGGKDMTPVKPQSSTGKSHQRVFGYPKEFDPDTLERFLSSSEGFDKKKVKPDFKVTIEDVSFPKIDFSDIKSNHIRRALNMLEFQKGYDHRTGKSVLYSPLTFNKRWEVMSQAFWYRSIGMPPKRIAVMLKVNYNTLKTWMKALSKYPLIYPRKTDWATGADQKGQQTYYSPTSAVDAPKYTEEDIALVKERNG